MARIETMSSIVPTMKSQGVKKNAANNAAQATAPVAAPVVEEEVIDFSKVQIEQKLPTMVPGCSLSSIIDFLRKYFFQ